MIRTWRDARTFLAIALTFDVLAGLALYLLLHRSTTGENNHE